MPSTSVAAAEVLVTLGAPTLMLPLYSCFVAVYVVMYCAFFPCADAHVVAVKLFPELAAAFTHDAPAISVGPVVRVAQSVAVQALPELALAGVQLPVGTLVVL